ncbi:glycosyltransferase [Thermoanaerobacterium thermosaccharolyticum]|uniref:glycosyltransferase n=1 Tax=Thermoanaerobacterium thermosaccharolyticum TaxID=1517 RepID=UPI003DA8866F
MDNNPLISVVMSVYNEQENWLIEAIESILDQTYRKFEFIIILDNPGNVNLKNIIKKYAAIDKRIKFVENKENIGLVQSLNRAIKSCNGEFIARMDADDISMKNRLEKQLGILKENPQIDLIGTNVIQIDEHGNEIKRLENIIDDFVLIKKLLKITNVFYHPTWMFRKRLVQDLGGYRDVPFAEDYDFVCRAISNGYKLININEYLLKYRIRNNSISRENQLLQMNVARYIGYLYKKNKMDICERDMYENINNIINSIGEKDINKFNKANLIFENGIRFLKNRKLFYGGFLILLSCLKSKYIFYKIYNIFSFKIIMNFTRKQKKEVLFMSILLR